MNMHKLSDYYPWNEESSVSEQFIMNFDNNSGSGEFSLLYLLLKELRTDTNVEIICANHDRMHYESILRKNNLDLNRLESSGKLKLHVLALPQCVTTYKSAVTWDTMRTEIESSINQSSKKFTLVIDDVDALELIALSPQIARQFFSFCLRNMHEKKQLNNIFAFGRLPLETLVQFPSLSESDHSSSRWRLPSTQNATGAARFNYPLDEENSEPSLSEYLKYRADITVTVSALESGYSTAIHGLISVLQPNRGIKKQLLQYRALDSGVVCSLVGDVKLQ